MNVEEQTRSLRTVVERYSQSRCEASLGEARAQAAALFKEAYHEARQRLRQAMAEERHKAQEAIATAQARAHTAKRLHQQSSARALLDEGWKRLRDELIRRWRDPQARHAWVEGLMREALAVLPGENWQIHHSTDWPAAEREVLKAKLAEQLKTPPVFGPDPAVGAGLRITAGPNVLDGTMEGILADRPALEARLLHYLEETRP